MVSTLTPGGAGENSPGKAFLYKSWWSRRNSTGFDGSTPTHSGGSAALRRMPSKCTFTFLSLTALSITLILPSSTGSVEHTNHKLVIHLTVGSVGHRMPSLTKCPRRAVSLMSAGVLGSTIASHIPVVRKWCTMV
jgi:hypothetical protein